MLPNPEPSASPRRQCKLPGCTASFLPPASAKNKEFCCASHRLEYHSAERKAGIAALRASLQPKEQPQ